MTGRDEVQVVEYHRHSTTISTIRRKVFIEEQKIEPALEFDGLDESLPQLIAYSNGVPVGTARMQLDQAESTIKLQRLAVLPDHRRHGIGTRMIDAVVGYAKLHEFHTIVLHAQIYALQFYTRSHFQVKGDTFMEVGIPHVTMLRRIDPQTISN